MPAKALTSAAKLHLAAIVKVQPLHYTDGMPTLHRIRKVQLCVFAADHPPPHFHAIASDWDALLTIESPIVFQGRVPPAILKDIKAWALLNQALLRQTWRALNT